MPRNRFEATAAKAIPPRFAYEAVRLCYTIEATYLPDFYDPSGKTIVELKGLWRDADRKKMRLIRQHHPDTRVIMVFYDPNRTISKKSKTTYRQWAEKHGIEVMTMADLSRL